MCKGERRGKFNYGCQILPLEESHGGGTPNVGVRGLVSVSVTFARGGMTRRLAPKDGKRQALPGYP